MVDATRIEEHPNWRQKRDPPKFKAKPRDDCDPDFRDDMDTDCALKRLGKISTEVRQIEALLMSRTTPENRADMMTRIDEAKRGFAT